MVKTSGLVKEIEMSFALPPMSPDEVVRQSFFLAAKAHQEGDLDTAEQLYRGILGVNPTHADALHGMGVLCYIVGRPDLAEVFLTEAIGQRDDPTFHNNHGLVLLARDRPHEALAAVYRALALRSDYPEAYNALGNIQLKLGCRDEAIASYQRATDLRPSYADAHANLAKAFYDKCDFDASEASCRRALEIAPDCPEACNTFGNILRLRGKYDESVSVLDRALAARPQYAEAHNSRSIALLMSRHIEEAIAAASQALACQPDFPQALVNLAAGLAALSQHDKALVHLERAVALQPDCLEAQNNLGATLMQLDRLDESIEAFDRAIDLSESSTQADGHFNLGTTLTTATRLDQAIRSFARALEINPNHVGTHNNLGVALLDEGLTEDAIASYGRALDIDPQYYAAHCNKLLAMQYSDVYGNDDLLATARAFGVVMDRVQPAPLPPRDLSPERRLRIGYVSGDFSAHPVGYFVLNSLEAHDRDKVEIYCYSNRPLVDFYTEEIIKHSDHWREIFGATEEEAAEMIRADEIDILVDLAGHTNYTRLPLFAYKPAPIQASWIGYLGTTGVKTIDYIILDSISAPPGTDHWYTESVVRLPYGRFCYRPLAVEKVVVDPPMLKNGYPTFGSFNNISKLRPGVIELWAKILEARPDARLVLKWKSMAVESVRERVHESFRRFGVAPERVDLRGPSPYPDMMDEYNDLDVALDPFPFGGATTSCEAMWMGVPVVTLPGEKLASRQTLGFLGSMGFDHLAVRSKDEYVARALELVADPEKLREMRHALRPAFEAAPFSDGPKFTATLESAYRQMWRRFVAGEQPQAFCVEVEPALV